MDDYVGNGLTYRYQISKTDRSRRPLMSTGSSKQLLFSVIALLVHVVAISFEHRTYTFYCGLACMKICHFIDHALLVSSVAAKTCHQFFLYARRCAVNNKCAVCAIIGPHLHSVKVGNICQNSVRLPQR
jgi:hypothetical protein